MDDQNNDQGQAQDNSAPFGQPANDDGALNVNQNQSAPSPSPFQQTPPQDDLGDLGSAKSFLDDDDDLLTIKQDALRQLDPLVEHLDQSPEEKFRTTMMMIQASDNQALVKSAYEAAQNITDEKERAKALLDVINEINYFTQPKK